MIKVKCSGELKDRRALETAESGEPLFGYTTCSPAVCSILRELSVPGRFRCRAATVALPMAVRP
jgi:hypothetical protein